MREESKHSSHKMPVPWKITERGGIVSVGERSHSLWHGSFLPELVYGITVALTRSMRELLRRRRALPPEPATSVHRLLTRDDGNPRCTACQLCATICPAGCIRVTPAPVSDAELSTHPLEFVVDQLRCIQCERCSQVCPYDALRLDSPAQPPLYHRGDGVFGKIDLMENQPASARP